MKENKRSLLITKHCGSLLWPFHRRHGERRTAARRRLNLDQEQRPATSADNEIRELVDINAPSISARQRIEEDVVVVLTHQLNTRGQ